MRHMHDAQAQHHSAQHQLHDVGTVFTALCVVHSRAVSSRLHLPPTTYPHPLACVPSPLVQLMHRAAGVRLLAGLCQGTPTCANSTREKGPHAPQYTH